MGVNQSTTLAPYGPVWREHRKLWNEHVSLKSVLSNYDGMIQEECNEFVRSLLQEQGVKETSWSVARL